MSSLGDLLLGKVGDRSPSPGDDIKPRIKQEVGEYDDHKKEHKQKQYHLSHKGSGNDSSKSPNDDRHIDIKPTKGQLKTGSKRTGDDHQDDEIKSNASSTDDYVRELLDPNDRPRNVWHVVEGPKDGDSPNESASNDVANYHSTAQRRNSQSSSMSRDEANDYGDATTTNPNTQVKIERDEQMRAIINETRIQSSQEKINNDDDDHHNDNIDEAHSNLSPNDERKSDQPTSHHHQVTTTETALTKDDDNNNDGEGSVRDKERRHRHRDKRDDDRSSDRWHRHDRRDKGDGSRLDRYKDDGRHKSSDKYSSKSRRSKYDDYSDDDEDYRYRKDRKRRRRSRSRSRSPGSRTSSSRRRNRSKSDSQSPVTKRDSRTILVMQLSPRVVTRDLEDFFNEIGRVREVRLIMDSKTRRHKGIAYIEFDDASTASKALALSGKKFHGVPMVIQSALSDKNNKSDHYSSSTSNYNSHNNHPTSSYSSSRSTLPPNSYRVYVGGLHVALTEDMLRSVFEPFGPIIKVEMMKDRNTGISRGYSFLTYANANDGQEAVRCLDGFELAGKNLRVSKSAEKTEH